MAATIATATTVKEKFFKNYRVYLLTSVAYMGSLLFGTYTGWPSLLPMRILDWLTGKHWQAMTRV